MERESFHSPEVAQILNDNFIPIKIDREERPDIDAIYMNYIQATTGSGGWPLNVFLTPDLQPVFGGTYWPGPGSSMLTGEGIGFVEILEKMRDVWKYQEEKCRSSAREITRQLREFAEEGVHSRKIGEKDDEDGLEIELLEEAYQHFESKYDKVNAGFATAPKFPTPVNLGFLLRLGQWPDVVKDVVGEDECVNAAAMALNTLRKMARGGIRDQIGYGFSRYSVTEDWSLPHFEKMLYDQAQLLDLYVDGFIISHDPEMLGVVYDIATYLTSPPMAASEGGFYSAEDADSYPSFKDTEKREGAYYVWTFKEFQSILGKKAADVCARFYGVIANGNVDRENDPHDELMGQNVLKIKSTPSALARDLGITEDEIIKILKDGRKKLREYREKNRPRPALDDKIVVAWNGLAIGALARTYTLLSDIDSSFAKTCLASAEKAVAFLKRELWDEETGKLWRIFREGRGDAPGFADDYAFLIKGLIDLYEATFNEEYLRWADKLQSSFTSSLLPHFILLQEMKKSNTNHLPASQLASFLSPTGAFYTTPTPSPSNPSSSGTPSQTHPSDDIILRLTPGMDSTEPSANSLSTSNLHRLSSLLQEPKYTETAKNVVRAFEAELVQYPFCFAGMLASVVIGEVSMRSILLITGRTGVGEQATELMREVRRRMGTGVGRTIVKVGSGDGWLAERHGVVLGAANPTRSEGWKVVVCDGRTKVCRDGVEYV